MLVLSRWIIFFQFCQISVVIYVNILFVLKQAVFDTLRRYDQGLNIKMILDDRLPKCGKLQIAIGSVKIL